MRAQNYPVHITTQLVAPFSGFIPDYANAGEEKLKLLLTFTDFTKPQYNVKLKISIQGQGITIQSKSHFFSGPFTLQPGIPFEISGADLYDLLNTQNLDFSGITKAQYEQKKVLPEGFYSICVTAYDFNNPTAIQVSSNACAQAWMVLSDPPFLNLPVCSSTVSVSNPQQQTFSFTQMNMGSPNSAANTEYVFELWEIRPNGAVPNNVVQTSPPIYTYTTNFTTVNYGITEPPLLPGMQYAWRVKAQDITGRDYFKNNGYSQVCTFTYGSAYEGLNLNLNVHAQAVSQRQIKVWWDSLANFTSYKLQFRKAGSNGNWFPVTTTNAHTRILDLEPQTTYEFEVRGESQDFTSEFSSPVNATTQPLPNYQCGELPFFPSNTNFSPLQQATPNMIWQVGQFEMTVLQLQNPISQNGRYSGYGKVKMPFIGFVYCSFDNIDVSNEHIVVNGKVNAMTKGIDTWINNNSVGTVQNGTEEAEVNVPGPLTLNDIHVNTSNGTVEVGGNTYNYIPDGTTIEDGNGNLFIVTADGQIINAGTSGNGHGAVPDSKNFIVTDKGTVTFNVSAKQLYGTDKFKYQAFANYYLTVKNLTSGEREPVNWKSVMAQKYDVIDLSYQLQGNLKADSILFMTGTGTIYKAQGTGTSRQLYIIGGQHGDAQELFACYRYSKDSLVNIAKINIPAYNKVINKVTLVPLENGLSFDKVQIQKELNEIYKQAVASWEVEIAPAINKSDTLWDKDGNGRLNLGSDLFNRYSSELKGINRYVRQQSYYKSGQYYLVVTAKPTDSLNTGILGEMPRGRNIGYLFTATPSATLIAHELGHGAFALEHSFDGNVSLPRGTTACLMDYVNGIELYKGKYWDYIHNPTSVVGALESDDDGSILTSPERKWIGNMLNRIKTACIENKPLVLLKNDCGSAHSVNDIYLGGNYYKQMSIGMPLCPGTHVSCFPKGNIKKATSTYWDAVSQSNKTIQYILIDNTIEISVPSNLLDNLIEFLDTKNTGKNLLIFANGYRPNPPHAGDEHVKEADEVLFTDRFGYWGGIDALFINRIGTKNVVYADGHHTVGTSNHMSEGDFVVNYLQSFCARGAPFTYAIWAQQTSVPLTCQVYYHNSNTFKLHTTPNNQGFKTRRLCGKAAGLDLILKIKNGTIKFDPAKDSIDIVGHSMGYAYALGIVDALKASPLKFRLGRFYAISAENACSSEGAFDLEAFEEVWQYGTDEEKLMPWEQDGVGPQCPIVGIRDNHKGVKYGRIHFPDHLDPKDYMNSHIIVSYFWLFSHLKIGNPGHVKPR